MRIALGKSRMALKWKNEDWTWEKLKERCSQTLRTKETVAEYKKMTRAQRDDIKDVGIGQFRIGFPDGIDKNVVFLKFINDGFFAFCSTPFVDKIIERGILAANILSRKGCQTLCYEGMAICT